VFCWGKNISSDRQRCSGTGAFSSLIFRTPTLATGQGKCYINCLFSPSVRLTVGAKTKNRWPEIMQLDGRITHARTNWAIERSNWKLFHYLSPTRQPWLKNIDSPRSKYCEGETMSLIEGCCVCPGRIQFKFDCSLRVSSCALASLGLVSPGAATDGATYFSLKTDDLSFFFTHRPLQSDDFFSYRLLTTPTFWCRLSSILSKFSHKKIILVGRHPLDGVTWGGPPPLPLVAPLFMRSLLKETITWSSFLPFPDHLLLSRRPCRKTRAGPAGTKRSRSSQSRAGTDPSSDRRCSWPSRCTPGHRRSCPESTRPSNIGNRTRKQFYRPKCIKVVSKKYLSIGVARGYSRCRCTPRREKRERVYGSAPPEEGSQFYWAVEGAAFNLGVFYRDRRLTTWNGVRIWSNSGVHARSKNPGYAYAFK